MKIHNIMEDIIKEKALEIFSDENLVTRNDFCNCQQCLSDVICFVLNRIKPVYIFSARGVAHFKMNYLENLQRDADLAAQIYRGIEQIAQARRPHCQSEREKVNLDIPHFNFPVITGKIFDSRSFEPVDSIEITLFQDGKLVETTNENWPNPYGVHPNTTGIYVFFPGPIEAPEAGIKRSFEFETVVETKEFAPLRHYFSIELESEIQGLPYFRLSNTFHLEDQHLAPANDTDNEEFDTP